MGIAFSTPEILSELHDCTQFSCGERSLDTWLIERALEGQRRGSARTYVVCDGNTRVAGYYALSAGAVIRADAPGSLRRNMPDPLPVIVLGRLAVDSVYQGYGLGTALLRDAMIRTLNASLSIGTVALVVHALNEDLRPFYQRYGFAEFPDSSLTFFLPIKTMKEALN
ncbi:MAG: GNAT family N-acetyltransferase [Thermomicrobiales bacterium]|nr:GNAT family N-acetyltransferase [Thermomicrobiales bacterium]